MKKLLALAAAMFSYGASASVLLWLVDNDAVADAGIDSWDTVKVSYGSSDDYTSASPTLLNIGGQAVSSSQWGTSLSSTQVGNIVEADDFALANLASVSDYSAKYFFIELYNGGNLVGYSQAGLGSELGSYIKEWTDLSNMTQSMTGWSPGGFTAVPEPTSGMLMLLGMALLGLRRKKAV